MQMKLPPFWGAGLVKVIMSLNGYIAVHGGAGLHGYTHECEVKQALRR